MDLRRLLHKPLHRKIAVFFAEHPQSLDSPRGVAAWVQASREDVSQALEELAKAGVLIADRGPTTTGYALTRDAATIEKIQQCLGEGA